MIAVVKLDEFVNRITLFLLSILYFSFYHLLYAIAYNLTIMSFSQHPTWMALYSLIVLMLRNYSLTDATTIIDDWLVRILKEPVRLRRRDNIAFDGRRPVVTPLRLRASLLSPAVTSWRRVVDRPASNDPCRRQGTSPLSQAPSWPATHCHFLLHFHGYLKAIFENVDATTIMDFIKEVNFYHLV